MTSAGHPAVTAMSHHFLAAWAEELIRIQVLAANGMITSSRRRLIGRLRAGDADGAAREMETHLRALCYMWRLAQPAAPDGAPRRHRPVRSFINPNGPWFHDQQECDDGPNLSTAGARLMS